VTLYAFISTVKYAKEYLASAPQRTN